MVVWYVWALDLRFEIMSSVPGDIRMRCRPHTFAFVVSQYKVDGNISWEVDRDTIRTLTHAIKLYFTFKMPSLQKLLKKVSVTGNWPSKTSVTDFHNESILKVGKWSCSFNCCLAKGRRIGVTVMPCGSGRWIAIHIVIYCIRSLVMRKLRSSQFSCIYYLSIRVSLCTTLCLQWEPEIIAVAVMHLSSKLTRFDITDWQGKPSGYRGKWYEFVVEDVTIELLEGKLSALNFCFFSPCFPGCFWVLCEFAGCCWWAMERMCGL